MYLDFRFKCRRMHRRKKKIYITAFDSEGVMKVLLELLILNYFAAINRLNVMILEITTIE